VTIMILMHTLQCYFLFIFSQLSNLQKSFAILSMHHNKFSSAIIHQDTNLSTNTIFLCHFFHLTFFILRSLQLPQLFIFFIQIVRLYSLTNYYFMENLKFLSWEFIYYYNGFTCQKPCKNMNSVKLKWPKIFLF